MHCGVHDQHQTGNVGTTPDNWKKALIVSILSQYEELVLEPRSNHFQRDPRKHHFFYLFLTREIIISKSQTDFEPLPRRYPSRLAERDSYLELRGIGPVQRRVMPLIRKIIVGTEKVIVGALPEIDQRLVSGTSEAVMLLRSRQTHGHR